MKNADDQKIYKRLQFHISQQDYFGTLATVLSLNLQLTEKIDPSLHETTAPVINDIVDDLMFLQKNFKITKK